MNRIRWYGPTVALLIVALMVMLIGPRLTRGLAYERKAAEISYVRNALDQNNALAELSRAFADVAEVVKPSVVSITVLSRRDPSRNSMRELPPGFREMIPPHMLPDQRRDRRDGNNGDRDQERYNTPQPVGSGSGWVFDQQGHIVTNNHVVTEPPLHTTPFEEIRLRFADGSEHEATVIGMDPKTDIAVLKIEGDHYHAATLADKPVHQGEIVFAFGSPLRYEFSMSQGIVSAKGRTVGMLRMREGYEDFIQTDAAINPGNSGGPLTNIYGQVVGMNTLIASASGNKSFSGLGFAIPADIIKNVVEQLVENGEVARGYLGISIDELSPKMARTYGFDGKGVLVIEPQPGTPAAKAGIQADDIITSVNGQPVEHPSDLRLTISGLKPDTEVQLELFRDGKVLTKSVTLMRLPDDPLAEGGPATIDPPAEAGEDPAILRKLGFQSVRTLTPELAEQEGVDYVEGVLVGSVRERSAAASVGLSANTIITHVVRDKVRSVEDLLKALDKYPPTDGVRLRVKVRNPRTRKMVTGIVLLELTE